MEEAMAGGGIHRFELSAHEREALQETLLDGAVKSVSNLMARNLELHASNANLCAELEEAKGHRGALAVALAIAMAALAALSISIYLAGGCG